MPITKSAKKSLRVSLKKREMNRTQEIELEKAVKKVSASNLSADRQDINEVISKIDKAAKTHLISKNKAARMKSRLAKKFGTPKKVKTQNSKVKTVTKKPVTKAKTAEVK